MQITQVKTIRILAIFHKSIILLQLICCIEVRLKPCSCFVSVSTPNAHVSVYIGNGKACYYCMSLFLSPEITGFEIVWEKDWPKHGGNIQHFDSQKKRLCCPISKIIIIVFYIQAL